MIIATLNSTDWLAIIVVVILLGLLGYRLYDNMRVKQNAKYLNNEEFKEGMRRAQIIDLREKSNFDAGHILGARNVPYSTIRNFYRQIRPDLPVYLYDQGKTLSKRAVLFLSKKGYKQLYILNSGYQNWDGKEKKSNK